MGVHVRAEVNGLTGEKHGFHIHTFGDCTAVDGTSTGGHLIPMDLNTERPDSLDRHMGANEVNEDGLELEITQTM